MGLLILVVIVFILAFIGLGFRFEMVTEYRRERREDEARTGYVYVEVEQDVERKLVWRFRKAQFLSPLVLIIMAFSTFTVVGAVQEGILYDPFSGGVQQETLGEGFHWKSPFANVAAELTKTQQAISYEFLVDQYGEFAGDGDSFSVQTMNGEYAMYSVELKYKVDDAFLVYNEWKAVPDKDDLSQYVQAAIKGTAIQYDIYSLLGVQFEVSRVSAEDRLRESLDVFGINLIAINFTDIYAGEEIENAILEQGTSAKQEQINVNLQNAAIIAAETARIEAEGIANAAIEAATGAARAVELEADAEAYAIEEVANAQEELLSLLGMTPDQYIDYIMWSNWNGELPSVMTDGGLIFDLPTE